MCAAFDMDVFSKSTSFLTKVQQTAVRNPPKGAWLQEKWVK